VSVNPPRLLSLISLLFIVPGGIQTEPKSLRAPTYYIATRVTYDGDPNEMRVVGASNLPPGASLSVHVYRFIGEGGSRINENASAVVGKEGLFEVTLHPISGNKFQHNLACDVVFMTQTNPPQPASVLAVVGTHGEQLGFPKNPQTGVVSGENYVLSELVHVP